MNHAFLVTSLVLRQQEGVLRQAQDEGARHAVNNEQAYSLIPADSLFLGLFEAK